VSKDHSAFCLNAACRVKQLDLCFRKHRLDLKDGSKVTSVPPQVSAATPHSVNRAPHTPMRFMAGPRTARMLPPYQHIIRGCHPFGRSAARRQAGRCRYSLKTCLVTYKDQSVKKRGAKQEQRAYLILTSSNGTTTKLSVAPALQPVMMESCLVISGSPDSVLNVFPQKSFAALSRDRYV